MDNNNRSPRTQYVSQLANIISLFINNSDINNSLSRIIHFNHAAVDNNCKL